MLRSHPILCLSVVAIIAAHAELFYSDILSSNSFPGLEQSGDENTFDDMFQSFDSSFPDAGDLNIDLFGSSDFGSNDPMLSADVADDQCLSFFSSSLLDGKARRRRGNDPAKCSSGGAFPSGEVPLGEVPSGEVPDLSPESVEAALATPTEFELQSCTGAGHFGALAFLVCASLTNSDARTNLMSLQFRVFTLFHSTRVTTPQQAIQCSGGLYCCKTWVPNTIYISVPDGTGIDCQSLKDSQIPL